LAEFSLSIETITIIILAILGGIAIVWKWRDRRTKVDICCFQEPNTEPILWKIRVGYWNKRIEKCNILFNDTQLFWDKTQTEYYNIVEGGAGNVTIPREIIMKDAKVIVKSSNKVINKKKFCDIKECN